MNGANMSEEVNPDWKAVTDPVYLLNRLTIAPGEIRYRGFLLPNGLEINQYLALGATLELIDMNGLEDICGCETCQQVHQPLRDFQSKIMKGER